MRVPRGWVVAALVAGIALSACTGSSGGTAARATGDTKARTQEAQVLVSDPTGASMSALTSGQLEVLGGCLGAGGSVIVWPPGTKVVKTGPLTISIPSNGTFSIGDEVSVGGGYIHEPPNDPVTDEVKAGSVEVPDACKAHPVFLAGPEM